jgi:anaerobic selenocysteine-containing dehydrogenase
MIRTTCPYCGVGCGILAAIDGTIAGDPEHPANRGRICSKGAALGETLGSAARLLHPQIRCRTAGWDEALDLVAETFLQTIVAHGSYPITFYVSGQLLTEDYYVANKLMKGFIGSANIDTNSRLCMASSVAGHIRAFGEDVVPGCYDDIEAADLIVLVGSNLAWCHPVLYQRLAAAREAHGTRVVVIDPRRTASCEIADLHLALRPGMGPLSLTGQPNAMGGREVGGLANQLAAHLGFAPAEVDRVQRFWNATRIASRPGLKAVELFDAVHDGDVKALWIIGTNPAASMPRASRVRDALGACPFVVVSDCWPTDTTRFADVELPAGRRLGREGRDRHQLGALHLAPARVPPAAVSAMSGVSLSLHLAPARVPPAAG